MSYVRLTSMLRSFSISLRNGLNNGKTVEQNVPILSQADKFVPFTSSSRSYCSSVDESDGYVQKTAIPRKTVDLETSIKYMKSKAYEMTYKGFKVWQPYRRNLIGHRAPTKTRKNCFTNGVLSSGNPCAICRDDHLVLHAKNPELLQQFISPLTGEILDTRVTNLCRKQNKELHIAMNQAWDAGTVKKNLQFKTFDYARYYPQLRKTSESS